MNTSIVNTVKQMYHYINWKIDTFSTFVSNKHDKSRALNKCKEFIRALREFHALTLIKITLILCTDNRSYWMQLREKRVADSARSIPNAV